MNKIDFPSKVLIEIAERSSTISERLGPGFVLNEFRENDAVVNARIEKWCQVVAEGNWEKFERRLAWDSFDLSTIRRALGSVRIRDQRHLPAWVETLNECLKATTEVNLETLKEGVPSKKGFLNPQSRLPFEEVLLPFIYVARQKLITQTGSHYELLSKEAHARLERSLIERLIRLCSPSMELEFSVFRASRQSSIARLARKSTGNHSKKQYQDFIKHLLTEGLPAFFREYPVLARLVATVIDLWVDSTGEFLCRLASDRSEIQKTFQGESELGQVIAVLPDLSDHHHHGRSVMVLTFASGLKLVYKPKNLDLEEAYFRLLEWLNQHGILLPFKLLKMINHSTYGWVEYVETLPCKDREEARRYYQRAGILLCLMYVLEATDIHIENIIACGEHAVLIDLETLMHPRVRKVENLETVRTAEYLANHQIEHSVLRTGLLPRWEFSLQNEGYDPSGLGGSLEQEVAIRELVLENINTDGMVRNYKDIKMPPRKNAPSLEGVNLAPNDYHEDIVDGFRHMYRFLMKHCQAILDPNGPLKAFAHQLVRFLFRPTNVYGLIRSLTKEPQFLRDGGEWSILFDVLSIAMLFSDSKPLFWPLLREEKKGLEQMDIPLFTARSDSDALTVAPYQTIGKCFIEPSFHLVTSRLNLLSHEDLELQINIIQGSLYSLVAGAAYHSARIQNSSPTLDVVAPLTRQEMLQQAIAIATDLQERAICSSDGSAIWIAPQYSRDAQRFQLQALGIGLYDGSCGVALFLAALEKITGGAEFRDLALGALQSLRHDLERPMSDSIAKEMSHGGAVGIGSIIYALVRISELLDDPLLLADAKQSAVLITPDVIVADQKLDIIFGTAGAIMGLLALYNISAEQEVLERAVACGHHLLNNRVASDSGHKAWATLDGKLLTGFSHGAAGIAYALLRLYQVTEEVDFLEAAQQAIAYERSVFIPEVDNWPDFRSPKTEYGYTCMCSWCHGAPGIGLARLAGLSLLDTDEIRQDVEVAINTTKQHQLSDLDHLCCGNLGRVEFLFTAARKLQRPQLLEVALAQAAQIVARAEQRGGFAYGPTLDYHPGFFQGAAGIGYELLRLAYPDLLPSVLLWE